jgi:hypothetical protein
MGNYEPYEEKLRTTFNRRFQDLGYRSNDFRVLCGYEISERERRAPFAAIYFGHDKPENDDPELLKDVLSDSAVLLPIVDDISKFSALVPRAIKHINGVQLDPGDPDFERDVGTVVENFRLLRKDRRLFISYKRDDARRVALQLYEVLDERGFDVFLDTHGVPPGEDFQEVLWHRLADSDVVVLLDTPHFFESRWTQEELTRANATSVQVLHLLWPGRTAPSESSLSSFLPLDRCNFPGEEIGDEAVLRDCALEKIAIEVEALRARALAARHRFLVDAFCDEARRVGLDVDVQPARHVEFRSKKNKGFVVPIVGVPSAQRLHEIYRMLSMGKSGTPSTVWALYDNRGLLRATLEHLAWLNIRLPLKAVSVYEVSTELRNEAST